MMTVIHDKRYL